MKSDDYLYFFGFLYLVYKKWTEKPETDDSSEKDASEDNKSILRSGVSIIWTISIWLFVISLTFYWIADPHDSIDSKMSYIEYYKMVGSNIYEIFFAE